MAERRSVAPTARSVASQVLVRVHKDKAFAAAALDSEIERNPQLKHSDRRLATELVYGVLRCGPYLEQRLAAHAPRGLAKLGIEARTHLLIAAYQLVCLDRVPSFAAVSDAVQLVRSSKSPAVASFANAVLRKLSTEVEQRGHVSVRDAAAASLPEWLVKRLAESVGGREEAVNVLTAGPTPPPMGLRVRLTEDRDVWCERISVAVPGAQVQPGRVSPLCITVRGAGKAELLPGAEQGAWSVQEEGSQVLSLATGARDGERVLDACAGRGNKTTLLAELVSPNGTADAADLYPAKLDVLQARFDDATLRLGQVYGVDWSVGPGAVPTGYDRVLIDAPCSGTGTIRRRPDLLTRDLRTELPKLQALQVQILVQAAQRCRVGGRILYGVCSLLREEAEEVVARAVQKLPGLQPVDFDAPRLGEMLSNRSTLRLLPGVHGTDGYFMASLTRT